MFNIQNKYTGNGCYRFLNSEAKTIYIGKSKNIHKILFGQHFKSNGSNAYLPAQCYNETYKIEIIPTHDNAQALALKQYLVDKYRPKYNNMDKRKDIFNETKFEDLDRYVNLEKWKLYFTFKEYDFNKIKTSRFQNKLALLITILFFISTLLYLNKAFLF